MTYLLSLVEDLTIE